MELPDGSRYALFGFPDLRRKTSKVLAVGSGAPYASVLALHRHPVATGVCVDAGGHWVPARAGDLDEVCERVTGDVPPDGTGVLFAVQGDAVWIEREGQVVKWDGRREVREGTSKQALASLALHWSNK